MTVDKIMHLRHAAKSMPPEAWGMAMEIAREADSLEHELGHYVRIRKEIQALVGDWQEQREATALLNSIAQEDLERKLLVWRAGLVARGYITQEQADSVDVRIPAHAPTVEHVRELEQKSRDLQAMRQRVLESVTDKAKARRIYNFLDEPLSEHKIDRWVDRCIRAKLLPHGWKMLPLKLKNKMRLPTTEDKSR